MTAVALTNSLKMGHYMYLKTNETLKYKTTEFFVEYLITCTYILLLLCPPVIVTDIIVTEILFCLSSPLQVISAKTKITKMANDAPYILALVTRIVKGRNIETDSNISYK